MTHDIGGRTADQAAYGAERQLFYDDFRSGFGAGAKWLVPPRGHLAAGDGVITCSASGVTVVSTGVDASTGRPAFAVSYGPDAPEGGGSDHIKWAALARSPSGAGGFAVPSTGTLRCAATVSARSVGAERHPFGSAVADPDTDPRLATAGLLTTDPDSHLVFDILATNRVVYALYERIRVPGTRYAAFSYAVPVAARTPDQWHTFEIRVDRGGSRVTWQVDGRPVLSVDRLGRRACARKHLLLDHGGREEPARVGRLTCGVGMFTMLDGAGPDGRGLVRLDHSHDHYFDVARGRPEPQRFVDDRSAPGSRIWGMGEILRLREFGLSVHDQEPSP
ncbi:hypothetical protein Drose_14755 [Dactylosporangium roseum]|uniref:Uncharacterized protein n=1 Tax=Dactylosporangium roseum TaxID=47989 RepID=A0ABY5ZBA9_9ACTN|nr:DUF6081 family protein [Dactylosporangium roseum]UWZ39380.1 hypothetical protein Drose_14755 [Dactylosporangium roseum]